MPDQLPSAILDSTNSFDSIFALDIDTKQRFDNILNNQQKPIDYPLPDYNKDFTPQGLPQDDLLNPQKMAGTLGEALFSTDPRIAGYAVDKMRAGQAKLPVNQGISVPDRFEYSKEMDKFLKGDYGYNPYMSIEDNEDFNYRHDYMSHTMAGRFLRNIGTGTTRFLGSVLFKLGQTLGYMGSMIGNGVEELINSKENNFMADVADNSMSRWFEGLEEDMKSSNLLSVFKPRGWEDKGFFSKLTNGGFWTDEVADGAAFMGEMIASMYLMGGLGRIGAVGRLGATEINLAKSLGKLGTAGRYAGRGLDTALKLGTGANNLSGIGRWAFATTSESAFEASQLYNTRKDELKAARQAGKNTYTDQEIEAIAGDSAAASFKANLLVLSASNAFENRFIFNPLFKRLGVNSPNPRGRLISVSNSTENLDELAKAARREYNYSTWLGKKLDWKNSNSRLRFYGGRGLSATAMEGFWEENAQLAVERLASVDNLSFSTFAKKLKDQTVGNFTGSDPEAATNIGLGALIGIGGTSIVSKVRGGDKLFQGERRKIENDTQKAIQIYEQSRRNFLNFQDIYIRDDQTGKPVLDADGNLQIDPVKAAGVFDGINAFTTKQEAATKVNDPLLRKFFQDSAMMDYVTAAKNAGIFNRAINRFNTLGDLTVGELENLGFDPNTTVDTTYLRDSMKEFGKIYEDVQALPSARLGKSDTINDELSRKNALYKAKATVYSTTKLMNEYQSVMLDRDFPSAFSPEAEGNTSEVQQYNSLVYREDALNQWAGLAKENGDFYKDFIEDESQKIREEKLRILEQIVQARVAMSELGTDILEKINSLKTNGYNEFLRGKALDKAISNLQGALESIPANRNALDGLVVGPNGIMFSPTKYGRSVPEFIDDMNKNRKSIGETFMMQEAIENDAQKKNGELMNERARHLFLAQQFASIQNGIKNYKEYIKFHESIQKKDEQTDPPLEAQPTAPAVPPTQPPTGQEPAAQPQAPTPIPAPAPELTKAEAVKAEDITTGLTNMLTEGKAAFDKNDPNDLPNFDDIGAFIDDNLDNNRKAIENVISKFMSSFSDPVIDQIRGNTFDPNSISAGVYRSGSDFMDALMDYVTDDPIKESVLTYLNAVDDAIDNYKASDVELNEAENNAVALISSMDIENSTQKNEGYPDLTRMLLKIANDTSTNSERKQALKFISDQLFSPETAEAVGTILGGRISQAIEDLNYPAPETTEELQQVVSEAPVAPTNPALLAAMEAAGLLTKEEGQQPTAPEQTQPVVTLQVGDTVVVHTEKDGKSTIKELRGDKALLSDGRQVLLSKLTKIPAQESQQVEATEAQIQLPPTAAEIEQPQTQAELATSDTEGSGIQPELPPPPAEPPQPPKVAENSDEASVQQSNFIDVQIDEAKRNGQFSFVQNMAEEVVMEGDKAKITNGAIQLKTTSGNQQRQLLRQHNILKRMGDNNNPVNFFSEDEEGSPLYKIQLKLAGIKNAGQYENWVYDTAKGKTNPVTGKPYAFPFIIATVVDQNGDYVYFDDQGNITTRAKGLPFGFPYVVEDYKSQNLAVSRKGLQLGTMEPLNGAPGFLNDNPLTDIATALQKGVDIYASIDLVTSGKLSTYNVDNSGATWAKVPQQRTVEQMEKDGDITSDAVFVLQTGNYITYPLTTASDTRKQEIKVGQPFLFDEKSGLKLPLRGKKIKDLTINGKPFLTDQLRQVIEGLSNERRISIDADDMTPENYQLMENLFNMLRALVYSQNTPVFITEDRTTISILDQRPTNISLLETEINYSTGITILSNPLEADEEGFSYDQFVKENFLSGAVPAELVKGEKSFEKLNQRVIFTLDKDHQQILDSIGSKAQTKSIRVKATDFSKFVNKTYRKKGGNTTVTVTGYSDGNFTIEGASGTITQSATDFLKALRNLEEVKLPAPTEEVKEDFENNIKLSQDEQKALNEQAKNMSKEDLDNLDFNC